ISHRKRQCDIRRCLRRRARPGVRGVLARPSWTVVTVKNAGPVPWRGWGVLFWVGLTCWVVGFVWHWSRPPSLWLLAVPAIPLMALLYWLGFVAVVVAVVGGGRWAEVLTLVPVLIVITALVNPAWRFAPRTWFIVHRPLFEMALATDPGHDYYGNQLPPW